MSAGTFNTSRGTTRISLRDLPAPPEPEPKNGHEDGLLSYGVVYANPPARAAMTREASEFPAGSVIVREKLLNKGDASPALVLAMIKRARSFNPRADGWEFITVDGARTRVIARQKKGDCLDCHASQRARDFVFPLK